jgi:uncharacterized protein
MVQLESPTLDSASVFMPMLDLFQQLRNAGMQLTFQDYELLRQALGTDYLGTEPNWDDLQDLCQLLWVKPSLNYDAGIFQQEFDRYQQQYEKRVAEWLTKQQRSSSSDVEESTGTTLGVLPTIPPRKKTSSESSTASESDRSGGQGLDAVKRDRPQTQGYKPEFTVQVPISQEVFQRSWRTLRRPIADLRLSELDVSGTVERIGREGLFSDVVTCPMLRKKAELLLLVDDGSAMLPFAPVIEPLIQTVLSRRISPALIYRFNQFPTNYLYEWRHPLRGIPVGKVLGRLNRQRTIVIILSDAGAASPLYHQERVTGTGKFLERLLPCVREVLWLNPLPLERWVNTTAALIQTAMAERMAPFDMGKWQQLSQTREFKSGIQLWSLMQNEMLRSNDSEKSPSDKLPYLPSDMGK